MDFRVIRRREERILNGMGGKYGRSTLAFEVCLDGLGIYSLCITSPGFRYSEYVPSIAIGNLLHCRCCSKEGWVGRH